MDRHLLEEAYAPDAFRAAGRLVLDTLAEYLTHAQDRALPVLESVPPDELARTWDRPFPTGSVPDEDRGRELVRLIRAVVEHSNHLHHPGYIGHQVSVPLPEATLLEMTSALLNNGMAIYEMGQLQTVMERRVVEFLCQVVGFDASAGGVLTSGGSLGNFTALLAARQAMAGHDVWTEGQRHPMAVLVSDQAHYCIARTVQAMGWGSEGAWKVPSDERFRMDPAHLGQALSEAQAAGRQIIAVVASECSTATGSFDPLEPIADFCAEHGLWLHVDGAHGASLALSHRHRDRLSGIERADSVVWDLHKLAGLPALNTAVLFRDARRSHEAFAQEAGYLFDRIPPEDEWFHLGQRTMECTKRGMSVTTFCMLQLLGTEWFGAHVDRLLELTTSFQHLLEEAPEFELACPAEANILCFRHRLPEGSSDEESDRLQARIREEVLREGHFYIVQTRLRGTLWLRVTVMNPRTTHADLEHLIDRLRAGRST